MPFILRFREEDMSHYHIERKRAAVEVLEACKKLKTEHGAKWLRPEQLASVAAGGASARHIYAWAQSDLTEEAQEELEETRGRNRVLSEDQQALLVGFAVSSRSSLEHLSLDRMKNFCESYLGVKLSLSTISRIMKEFGFSSQKAMSRNSRMVSHEVVEDALSSIAEIRSFNFPPHRVLAMDETGLWSNVTAPRTYHFSGWYEILFSPETLTSPKKPKYSEFLCSLSLPSNLLPFDPNHIHT